MSSSLGAAQPRCDTASIQPHVVLARALACAALLAALLLPCSVHAQRLGAQRFSPAGSEDGIFEAEGADRRAVLAPYVALWANYAFNPLVVVDGNGERVGSAYEHVVGFDLVATMAIWEGLEVGVGLPVTAFASGDDALARSVGINEAYGPVLGDVSLRIAYRVRVAEHTAIALHVPVLFPTNPDDTALALGLGVRPTFALLQRFGPVELVLNISALFRESQTGVSDYRGGSELGARLGARFDLSGTWSTALLAEIGASTAFDDFFGAAETPAEARGGIEHWFDAHWRGGAFVGAGIGPGVGAPDVRAGLSIAYGDNYPYRPRPSATDGDSDGDGVRDSDDQCPDEPEDPDGWLDEDGCPEEDNDGDGIADLDDSCPNEPETTNGISDEDGCPDLVRLEESLITTFEPVYFRTGSEEILERSHPMLIEIGGVLRVHTQLRIRVEGHTDSAGDDETNLVLSRQRAASVRQFLVEHGAHASQIESEGYGETRPIASNATAAGRSRNRRVEFHVLH